ncbi:MAG: pantoate--beta-alanine ligase [Pseudomonadota bacterium]
MEIFTTKSDMQAWSKSKKQQGKTICFVPTMGYLHQGHVSLMEKGKPLCDELVLSIFVNPTQFGANEDLDSYPSDIDNDLVLAKKAGVTAVFLPTKAHIYPKNFQTEVKLLSLPNFLCGKFRPIHFTGVATVVTKLFNIVMPDVAIFGQKDYQQLQIIRQLTLDLDFDITILAGDIIREADGLAMSSRNAYLSKSQRASALSLNQSLKLAKQMIATGQTDADTLKTKMESFIHSFEHTNVEYITFCDPVTLEETQHLTGPVLLALAVKVGTTRLIDNALVNQ